MNVPEAQPLLKMGGKNGSSPSYSVRSAIAASLIVGCVVAVVAVSGNFFGESSSTPQATSTPTAAAVKIPIAVPTEHTHRGDVADGVAEVGTRSARVSDARKAGMKVRKDAAADTRDAVKSAKVISKVASSSSTRSHHASSSSSSSHSHHASSSSFSSSVEDVAANQKTIEQVARDPEPLVAPIGFADAPTPGPTSGDDYDAHVPAPAADAADAAAPAPFSDDILDAITEVTEVKPDALVKAQKEHDADAVAPAPSFSNGDEEKPDVEAHHEERPDVEAHHEEEEEAPSPYEEATFTDEVFRADIAHGASDAVVEQIMLQKAVDHHRATNTVTLDKFTFFIKFIVTVGGDVDCKHLTPETIEKYVAVGSTFVGRAVAPHSVQVEGCLNVRENVTEFPVKVFIPRVNTTTDPIAESAALLALFEPSTFQQALAAVDGAVRVETVSASQPVVHGEITVKMSPAVFADVDKSAAKDAQPFDMQKFKDAMREEPAGKGKGGSSED